MNGKVLNMVASYMV